MECILKEQRTRKEISDDVQIKHENVIGMASILFIGGTYLSYQRSYAITATYYVAHTTYMYYVAHTTYMYVYWPTCAVMCYMYNTIPHL